MTQPDPAPLVAIVNTSEEILSLLRHVFEDEGFRTVGAYVVDLRRGEPSPDDFLREHRPRVIVWDIAIPYEENWEFLQRVRNSEQARAGRFVLTTTNRRALESLVGASGALEIIGRPFDLDELIDAVRRAARMQE